MGQNFYFRAPKKHRPETLTVGQLISLLKKQDMNSPVIFQLPEFGAFGSRSEFTIDKVDSVYRPKESIHHVACESEDEETGEKHQHEAWTEEFPAFSGVVIK